MKTRLKAPVVPWQIVRCVPFFKENINEQVKYFFYLERKPKDHAKHILK